MTSMNTMGLGAGSYPEPCREKGEETPRCEECGWPTGIREIDGNFLCEDCREAYVLKAYSEYYWDFITSTPEEKRRFALNWWFQELPKEEQGRLAFEAFEKQFSVPWLQKEREREITGYVKDSAEEFLNYIEERKKYEEF